MFVIGLKGGVWWDIKFIFKILDCFSLLFFLLVLNNWLRSLSVIVRFCFVIRFDDRGIGSCLLFEDEKLGNVFFSFFCGLGFIFSIFFDGRFFSFCGFLRELVFRFFIRDGGLLRFVGIGIDGLLLVVVLFFFRGGLFDGIFIWVGDFMSGWIIFIFWFLGWGVNGLERGVVIGDGWELFLRFFGRFFLVLFDLDLLVDDFRFFLVGEGIYLKLLLVEGFLLL